MLALTLRVSARIFHAAASTQCSIHAESFCWRLSWHVSQVTMIIAIGRQKHTHTYAEIAGSMRQTMKQKRTYLIFSLAATDLANIMICVCMNEQRLLSYRNQNRERKARRLQNPPKPYMRCKFFGAYVCLLILQIYEIFYTERTRNQIRMPIHKQFPCKKAPNMHGMCEREHKRARALATNSFWAVIFRLCMCAFAKCICATLAFVRTEKLRVHG